MRYYSICILIALLLPGCNSQHNTVSTVIVTKMPEQVPDDFAFSVQFGINSKNVIDTYTSTVIKDLIIDGIAETNFSFTDEELYLIYEVMKSHNVLGTKDFNSNSQCNVIPYSEDTWKISIDGEERSYYWSGQFCELTEDAKHFLELRKFIWDIVTESD
ncbi:MAG TPA: hypothetical protein IAA29_03450 [Candidatus Paenibacillus intestinavium]|nr:hypothetical protein [Candidatus Paenibacillus intestinavium]